MPRTNIGTVEIIEDGQKRSVPVTACPGYGITCYALGVTNGYIIQVAQTLKNMVSSIPKLRAQHEDPSFDLVLTLEGEVRSLQTIDNAIEHLCKEWSPNPNRHPGRALFMLSRAVGTAAMISFFRRTILDGDMFFVGREGDEKDKWMLVGMSTDPDGQRYGLILPSGSRLGPLDNSGNHIVPSDCHHEGYVWKKDFQYTMSDNPEGLYIAEGETLAQALVRLARGWQDGKRDFL